MFLFSYTNKKVSTFTKFTEDNSGLVTTGRKKLRSSNNNYSCYDNYVLNSLPPLSLPLLSLF